MSDAIRPGCAGISAWIADLARNAFILTLQLGVGIALGFRWQTRIWHLLAAVGLALMFGFACMWIMATIGLAIKNAEAIQAAVYMVVFPLTLTSSVFLPTSTMPSWLAVFADHQPITTVANALRGLTLGQAALPAGHTIAGEVIAVFAWAAGILAVFAPLAIKTYRRTSS